MLTEFLRINIRRLRTDKGLTQEKLAERLGISGKTVSKWETGGSAPDAAQIVQLAGLFGVTTDELLLTAHAEQGEEPLAEEKRKLQLLTGYYGVTPLMLAQAAETTEEVAKAYLAGEAAQDKPSPTERHAMLRLRMTAALLTDQIPFYRQNPAFLLTELLSRLAQDNGLEAESAAKFAGLKAEQLHTLSPEGGDLTTEEKLRLLTVLVTLDRALNPTDPYPADRRSTRTSHDFRRLLQAAHASLARDEARPTTRVTVLEGLSGRLYLAADDAEEAICSELELADEKGLRRLVTVWDDGSLDLPSRALRDALLRWQPACGDAEILLDTAGSGARLRVSLANAARLREG